MKNKFFIDILFFNCSFLHITIYISNFLFQESQSSCKFNSEKLTKIIDVGEKYFRFVNFATYSNGDMVFLSNSLNYWDQIQNKRIFYGLKRNGRPLFKDSYFTFLFFKVNGFPKKESKYESESLVVKESGNSNNEYLMSFSKSDSFVEIYNFTKGEIYKKHLNDFVEYEIISYRHAFISLFSNDSNYFYLLGFINNDRQFIIQKHLFNSLENIENEYTKNNTITIDNIKAKGNSFVILYESGLSCFQTENHFIICFFLNENSNYLITAFTENLRKITDLSLYRKIEGINSFYKCLHLKGEIGVFTYYENSFPVLLFKEFKNNFEFDNYTIPEIILNKIESSNLYNDLLLNDIIKFNENKIYYCSTDSNKKNIYIISISLHNEKYKIRYYLIEIAYYNTKYIIYKDMRIHNYNNFLAVGFSYGSDSAYYCSLLICSYPNSTDVNFSLSQKLND